MGGANVFVTIVAASKAAYLSVLLRLGADEIRRYDPVVDLRSVKLGENVNPVMNKIKALRPEAFWYWMEIERMKKGL